MTSMTITSMKTFSHNKETSSGASGDVVATNDSNKNIYWPWLRLWPHFLSINLKVQHKKHKL